MMPRKRSFFSQDSGCSISSSSCDHLPMLTESRQCESPPPEGTGSFAVDFGALNRIVPGRASSMSIVRQRSGMSLSPPSKDRTRKTVSTPPYHYGSDSSLSLNHHVDNHGHNHYYNNPYGMLNPGSGSSSYKKAHNKTWACTTVGIMGFITVCVLAVSTYEHNLHLNHELTMKDHEIELHLEHSHSLERKVQSMRSEALHLHNRIEELENPAPNEEELNIQRKVFHLEHAQDQLHKGIAAQSKRLAVEKFGPGPSYYVEMKLSFDPDSNIVQDATTEIEDTILLETASIQDMPHTVHFFLEQVSHGVFDKTAFYSNAPRFVTGGPGLWDHKLQELKQESPSLARLLMAESNSHANHLFHHQQYTLGYSALGPDFYLNFSDNEQLHHKNDPVLTHDDPCFARVIRGFNTLERIHRSNVHDEDGYRRKQYRMIHPVTIETMRVLPSDAVVAAASR